MSLVYPRSDLLFLFIFVTFVFETSASIISLRIQYQKKKRQPSKDQQTDIPKLAILTRSRLRLFPASRCHLIYFDRLDDLFIFSLNTCFAKLGASQSLLFFFFFCRDGSIHEVGSCSSHGNQRGAKGYENLGVCFGSGCCQDHRGGHHVIL